MLQIVSIDFQKDFTSEGGVCYEKRDSVDFVKSTLVPLAREKGIKIAEIISDYRQPRLGDRGDCCHPGEWGYESDIPSDVKIEEIWLKCMNSPLWVRENIGNPDSAAGLPYQDPDSFSRWTEGVIGKPEEVEVVLIGLTVDCCVLCAAQEFSFRGYKVKVLKEAVDTYSGLESDKESICKTPLTNWAKVITWEELKKDLG